MFDMEEKNQDQLQPDSITKKRYSDSRDSGNLMGSLGGMSFVAKLGPLDCSIGTIFRDEFGKSLKMPKTKSQDTGRALSVLIIDDSLIQRKLTMRSLGGLIDEVVWMVEGVENGECALNLMETSPRVPDVIIVDQYMETSGGHLLGHEVVAELRGNSAFDSAVIIGCTGSVDTAAPLFVEAGCDAVWSKPMPSKQEAQKQIMTLLESRKKTSLFGDDANRIPGTINSNESQCGGTSTGPPIDSNQHDRRHTTPEYEPVFRQINAPRVGASSIASYFVTTPTTNTSTNSVNVENTPVFQFFGSRHDHGATSRNRDEEMNKVSEGISSINVRE